MAKLSARGRVELARVSKEWEFCHTHYTDRTYDWGTAPVYCKRLKNHEGPCDGDGLTIWERKTKALMSDQKVLTKLDCNFGPTGYKGASGKIEDHKHSYGWKVAGTLKTGVTVEQWVNLHLDKGYKRS